MNEGRSARIGYLNFGPPSIGREKLWCKYCKEYTLRINFGMCNGCKQGGIKRDLPAPKSYSPMQQHSSIARQKSLNMGRFNPLRNIIIRTLTENPYMSYTTCALRHGCSRSFVTRWANKAGIFRGPGRPEL